MNVPLLNLDEATGSCLKRTHTHTTIQAMNKTLCNLNDVWLKNLPASDF